MLAASNWYGTPVGGKCEWGATLVRATLVGQACAREPTGPSGRTGYPVSTAYIRTLSPVGIH